MKAVLLRSSCACTRASSTPDTHHCANVIIITVIIILGVVTNTLCVCVGRLAAGLEENLDSQLSFS